MKLKNKKLGFTLSEILVTLGVIGVVAALTIPTLSYRAQKKTLEAATKNFYTQLSQAVTSYMQDQKLDDLMTSSLVSEDAATQNSALDSFVNTYFEVQRTCTASGAGSCFNSKYYTFDKKTKFSATTFANKTVYVLEGGNAITIDSASADHGIHLFADVNAGKGPNRAGFDFWDMTIYGDGSVDAPGIKPECRLDPSNKDKGCWPPSHIREHNYERCKTNSGVACYSYGGGLFGHFINNNFKFDY